MTLFDVAWGVAFTMFMAAFIWQLMHRSDVRSYTTDEQLGSVDAFDIGLAHDGRRRLVGVTMQGEGNELNAYLTPSQARLLAEWLRVAAAPGRTLADARRRSNKVPA
jgi:hypothetical protein